MTIALTDALVAELDPGESLPRQTAPLPGLSQDGALYHELPLPGPNNPFLSRHGFPQRPRRGAEPKTEIEKIADEAFKRMEETTARVHELDVAFDQPLHVWERLQDLWQKAERQDSLLVSEIVHQAIDMPRVLDVLMDRLRKVLRREQERIGLDRVQEMDVASLIWLIRQPGHTLAERAGPEQRVRAVVRKESFDTGENRVLHAWCRLAWAKARDWMRHNRRAIGAERYEKVARLAKHAQRAARDLADLGVGTALPGIMPNFVLTQDPDYRSVHEAWLALLRENREQDELWAWQGRTWSDFTALAVTLALRGIAGAELVASCPLKILTDHDRGAWFTADIPLAVYHLRREGLIVEVQYRPQFVADGQDRFAAPLWLRFGDKSHLGAKRRMAVWPRLVFSRVDLYDEANDCAHQAAQLSRHTSVGRALVVHADPDHGSEQVSVNGFDVTSIGIGPRGSALMDGMRDIGNVLRSEIGLGTAP